jgi:8-oxo-dGTP pyrophosphatase MutT (NUDIX family)
MAKHQSAAIPYREGDAGELLVLLVSSRKRGRWILPKGRIGFGASPHRTAALEAFEEGGVLGAISTVPVGTYRQVKLTSTGEVTEIGVDAYPMFVNTELRWWPEMAVRKRCWMRIEDALNAVDSAIGGVLRRFLDRRSVDGIV